MSYVISHSTQCRQLSLNNLYKMYKITFMITNAN